MLRDMTVLSRDARSCTGVFRLDGHRKPFYFVALRAPSGFFRVQRVYPQAPVDANAAVSQALNGSDDKPPERSRGGEIWPQPPGLPRRAVRSDGLNTSFAM